MRKIFLVRHAESEANIGVDVLHNHTIKITELGKQQAKDLVELIEKPDRIIVSKFIRTQETAQPTLEKFIDISEAHLWLDTHEFDFMNHSVVTGLTLEEKEKKVTSFFENADSNYKHDSKNESFKEFSERVEKVILKIQKLNGVNYIFTHSFFIKNFYNLLTYFKEFIGKEKPVDFYDKVLAQFKQSKLEKEFLTPNATIFEFTKEMDNL